MNEIANTELYMMLYKITFLTHILLVKLLLFILLFEYYFLIFLFEYYFLIKVLVDIVISWYIIFNDLVYFQWNDSTRLFIYWSAASEVLSFYLKKITNPQSIVFIAYFTSHLSDSLIQPSVSHKSYAIKGLSSNLKSIDSSVVFKNKSRWFSFTYK